MAYSTFVPREHRRPPGGRLPARSRCGSDVHVEIRCPHCERTVDSGELRARPGKRLPKPPGAGEPGGVFGRRLASAPDGVPLAG